MSNKYDVIEKVVTKMQKYIQTRHKQNICSAAGQLPDNVPGMILQQWVTIMISLKKVVTIPKSTKTKIKHKCSAADLPADFESGMILQKWVTSMKLFKN